MNTYLFIGCVSVSAFNSLVVIPIGTASSVLGLKNWAITVGTKNYKSIIKKKKKKHHKIVLLARAKLNSIKVLISRTSIDSHSSYDKLASVVNNVLREYDAMKQEIKNLKTSTVHQKL